MITENVAVLFTDVVGSTELAQSLSTDEADEVRREHFSVLRQAITEAGGIEVKSLGDGLMVVFASASAALGCAVAMQQGVERGNRGRRHQVGLRVGVSGGEVSREDDDYFGDPVVEASRLCSECAAGQVLAAEWVRLTAGRRCRYECRPVGGLLLKGLPDPVQAVEVVWEPLAGSHDPISVPLPGRLALRPAVGVIGRETDLAALLDATKRVMAGDGREVLLVSGEAGLGKTTLVAEAARSAFAGGACVLFGHCEEDLATPYQLFAEALGHWVTHAPEDELRAHVDEHGSELARLVPALASRIPDLPPSRATDSDTERYLLFAAVVGLLAGVSQHQPVVLVLDDLQWADKASLALLRHLAAVDQAMRLLVMGTFRDSELAHADALRDTLGVLRRQRGVSRIELAGLDDAGVVAFVEAAAGSSLDSGEVGFAHALYRETDGNPFFVGEVLRHLVETGAIVRDATGRWRSDASPENIALPDSVREVIGGRVARLGKDAERVLSLAAVIGRDFDLDVLAKVAKTSEDDLIDVLDAAGSAALVRELPGAPGHYNFAHALIQHTLYEDLGPTRRARAHRQVAEALEDLCGDRPGARVGELARHWLKATQPIDLTKAIGYARQAADAALAAVAPADALGYYTQAIDLYREASDPDPVLGLDLAIGLGTAQRQTGDPAYRLTLLDAARRAADIGDTEHLVLAALANDRGWATSAGAVDTDKVEVLETALAHLPGPHPDRARLLATLCSELAFGAPLERRQALADEAVAIAEACGDDSVIVWVNRIFDPLFVPSLLEERRTQSADALARAERIGDPFVLFLAAGYVVIAAGAAGDIDEIDRCLEIMRSAAAQLDQPQLNWQHMAFRAARALLAGDTDQAEQLATAALQLGTDGGQPDAMLWFQEQFLGVSWQRGTAGDLIALIEQALVDNPGLPGFAAALAVAYVEAHRADDARRLLDEALAKDFDLPMDINWLLGMVSYAEAAIECQDRRSADALFHRLAPYSDQCAWIGIFDSGPVSHYLGGLATVIGRYEDAENYFTIAATLSEREGARFNAARTNLLWGRMLAGRRAPGDAEKARDLLAIARTAAVANGYSNVEHRAAAALQLLDA